MIRFTAPPVVYVSADNEFLEFDRINALYRTTAVCTNSSFTNKYFKITKYLRNHDRLELP